MNFAPGKIPSGGKSPRKCIGLYSVPTQKMAKHRGKFGWPPVSDVVAVTKTRRETRTKPVEVCWGPQTGKQISAFSRPKFVILCVHVEEILLFNKFFCRLWIHALVAKIQPNKVVRWCPDGEFLAIFWVLYFQRAMCSTFQTCILNSQ